MLVCVIRKIRNQVHTFPYAQEHVNDTPYQIYNMLFKYTTCYSNDNYKTVLQPTRNGFDYLLYRNNSVIKLR